MRTMLALLFISSMSNLAHADEFELTVYFNLGVAEKHGIVRCALGGRKLKTEYHLTVFKDEPRYTFLGNLDLKKNVVGDIARKFFCDEGEFIFKKKINTTEDFINLFVYLEEIYYLKDEIFDVANVKLNPDANYFIQKKYINDAGKTVIETMNIEAAADSSNDDTRIDSHELVYSVEIRRM